MKSIQRSSASVTLATIPNLANEGANTTASEGLQVCKYGCKFEALTLRSRARCDGNEHVRRKPKGSM